MVRRRRWMWAAVLLVGGLGLGLFASTGCGSAFGAAASGSRLARMQRSPNHQGETFVNPVPTQVGFDSDRFWDVTRRMVERGLDRAPGFEIPLHADTRAALARPPHSGLRVTWMGHSTVLVEVDGARVLFDPVWSERVSPTTWAGPKRFHPPPVPLEDLPPLDAVVISHDHYDHLDEPTIRKLLGRTERFVVPLGVGAHLEAWDVPVEHIVELDWWEETETGGGSLTVACTPARHFSGRGLKDRNKTLWASWVVRGPTHAVYFGGDTGMFEGFAEIGTRYGPFDVSLLPIGAYDAAWPDVHLNPEEAVEAHALLGGGAALLPIHWASFGLAFHDWSEPAERLLRASGSTRLWLPAPGRPIEGVTDSLLSTWWRRRPDPKVAAWEPPL